MIWSPAILSMDLFRNSLLTLLLLFFVSSCGFKPLHNQQDLLVSNNSLRAIEIASINSPEGAEFYYHLSNILPQSLPAKYLLVVKLNHIVQPIAFQKNSEILRQSIHQNIVYQVINKATGVQLTSGQFNYSSSYNLFLSNYAAYIEQERKLEDISHQAAEEVRTRLILYFNSKQL